MFISSQIMSVLVALLGFLQFVRVPISSPSSYGIAMKSYVKITL